MLILQGYHMYLGPWLRTALDHLRRRNTLLVFNTTPYSGSELVASNSLKEWQRTALKRLVRIWSYSMIKGL